MWSAKFRLFNSGIRGSSSENSDVSMVYEAYDSIMDGMYVDHVLITYA